MSGNLCKVMDEKGELFEVTRANRNDLVTHCGWKDVDGDPPKPHAVPHAPAPPPPQEPKSPAAAPKAAPAAAPAKGA